MSSTSKWANPARLTTGHESEFVGVQASNPAFARALLTGSMRCEQRFGQQRSMGALCATGLGVAIAACLVYSAARDNGQAVSARFLEVRSGPSMRPRA
jgi:hypothetical protein